MLWYQDDKTKTDDWSELKFSTKVLLFCRLKPLHFGFKKHYSWVRITGSSCANMCFIRSASICISRVTFFFRLFGSLLWRGSVMSLWLCVICLIASRSACHVAGGLLSFLYVSCCATRLTQTINTGVEKWYDTIRYDTLEEFNVDSKAEYSSTRSQKLKQTKQCPLDQKSA